MLAGSLVGGVAGSYTDKSSTKRGALVGAATGAGLGWMKNGILNMNDTRKAINEFSGVEGGFFKKYNGLINDLVDSAFANVSLDDEAIVNASIKNGTSMEETLSRMKKTSRVFAHYTVAGETLGTIAATGATYLATTHFTRPVNKNK